MLSRRCKTRLKEFGQKFQELSWKTPGRLWKTPGRLFEDSWKNSWKIF